MRIKIDKLLASVFLAFLIGCNQDDSSRMYPRLVTESVTDITDQGVMFNASISSFGNEEITSVGFVWSQDGNPSIGNDEKVFLSSDIIDGNRFSFLLRTTLNEDEKYWVRAFVIQDELRVFGDTVSFSSLGSFSNPIITSFDPISGTDSTKVIILGEGFSHKNEGNKITFDGIEATVDSSTVDELRVIVPAGISTREVELKIEVTGNEFEATSKFIRDAPIIESFSPEASGCGTTVTITGNNFSTLLLSGNTVRFGDTSAEIVSAKSNELIVTVPEGLPGSSTISVTTAGQTTTSTTNFTPANPTINSFSPDSGTDGDVITIDGTNFGSSKEGVTVSFGNLEADIISANPNEIRVEVPVGISSREVDLTIEVGCEAPFVSATKFVRLAPSITDFNPKSVTCKELITITGSNFGSTTLSNKVYFDTFEGEVVSATSTTLEVRASLGLEGSYALSVETAGQTSVASGFINVAIDDTCNENLLAYYPFNGDVADETGNGNDGIAVGATLDTDRNGNPNSAYSFNGVSDYINIDAVVDDVLSNTTGSIVFWAKPTNLTAPQSQYFVTFGDFSNNRWLGVVVSQHKVRFVARDLNPILFDAYEDNVSLSNNVWSHIACVQDGEKAKVYINGTLVATSNLDTQTNEGAWFNDNPGIDNSRLGYLNQNNKVQGYYEGSLDELRIYNRALTESEVLILYNNDI